MKKSVLSSLVAISSIAAISCQQKGERVINPIVCSIVSDPFPPTQLDLIDSFILAYDRHPIKEFKDGPHSTKGFYLDEKIIAIIQDPAYQDSKGLYLYFAKRVKDRNLPINGADRFQDGKYTMIAIPSLPSINSPGRDSLIVDQSLEWHAPISSHQPVNEQEIGY